jgi:hypothetical protein
MKLYFTVFNYTSENVGFSDCSTRSEGLEEK